MKRFRFSLEQVLRLKSIQKQNYAEKLAQLNADYHRQEEKLDRLREAWNAEEHSLKKSATSLLAAEYLLRVNYLDYLDQQMQREQSVLMDISRQMAEIRQKLSVYAREENMLTRLRDKQRLSHTKEQERKEQLSLDDLTLQRRIFHRRQMQLTELA